VKKLKYDVQQDHYTTERLGKSIPSYAIITVLKIEVIQMKDKREITDISLSQLIKYMRENSGRSQMTLAKELGIAQTTLSGYETDYSEPNFKIVQEIAKICEFEITFTDTEDDRIFRVVLNKKD